MFSFVLGTRLPFRSVKAKRRVALAKRHCPLDEYKCQPPCHSVCVNALFILRILFNLLCSSCWHTLPFYKKGISMIKAYALDAKTTNQKVKNYNIFGGVCFLLFLAIG